MKHENEVILRFCNQEERYIFNTFAKQAQGSVYFQQGNNVLLASITIDTDEVVEEDFLPLMVQYIEKSYAAGKIPGGYVKREAKPGDFEVLTARIIDRSLRPLFPKDYCHSTHLSVLVLSADEEADLQVLAFNAASAAFYISEIPLFKPINAVRIGKIDGQLLVNPTLKQMEKSTLDLLVTGVDQSLMMIEMRACGGAFCEEIVEVSPLGILPSNINHIQEQFCSNEMSEDELLEALALALEHIGQKSKMMMQSFESYKRPPLNLAKRKSLVCAEIEKYIKAHYFEELQEIIGFLSKTERASKLKAFSAKIAQSWANQNHDLPSNLGDIVFETILKIKRECIRSMILNQQKRADGRGLHAIREIDIQTNFLPKAHASALFTRGQTQALAVLTLGGELDAQSYELLTDKGLSKERFMVHYNFPPFCVGEASSISAPSRRELGHGNLAKRALECSIKDSQSKTIRLVSEILESNGSSSMATVCAGSMALAAAGVECTNLIAGVAMGLVYEEEKYAILTDIMGLEDHDGDMDCKVAGSVVGVSAMQMDIKLEGVCLEIIKEVLFLAKQARLEILNKMEAAKKEIVLNEALPSLQTFFINPAKIVDVIGQAGRTIKEIIEKFEVAIDLNRDNGEVKVSGNNKDQVNNAREFILNISEQKSEKIVELYQVGDIFDGKVKKIVEFGAFIELPKGYDGLLHVSKVTSNRNEKISDHLNVGQEVRVEILSLNKNKVELGLVN